MDRGQRRDQEQPVRGDLQGEERLLGDYVVNSLYGMGLWCNSNYNMGCTSRYTWKMPKTRDVSAPASSPYLCADGEWIKLDGATKAEYSFVALAEMFGWQFRCLAKNADGEAWSKAATLLQK